MMVFRTQCLFGRIRGVLQTFQRCCIWDVGLEIKSVVSWELAGITVLCQGVVKRHSKKVVLKQQSDAFKLDLPLWEGLISILVYSSWVSIFRTNLYHGNPIQLLLINYRIGVELQHPSKHLHADATSFDWCSWNHPGRDEDILKTLLPLPSIVRQLKQYSSRN